MKIFLHLCKDKSVLPTKNYTDLDIGHPHKVAELLFSKLTQAKEMDLSMSLATELNIALNLVGIAIHEKFISHEDVKWILWDCNGNREEGGYTEEGIMKNWKNIRFFSATDVFLDKIRNKQEEE